jgi:hypothetical protein
MQPCGRSDSQWPDSARALDFVKVQIAQGLPAPRGYSLGAPPKSLEVKYGAVPAAPVSGTFVRSAGPQISITAWTRSLTGLSGASVISLEFHWSITGWLRLTG